METTTEAPRYTYAELVQKFGEGSFQVRCARDFLVQGTHDDWADYLLDMWKSALEQIGFCNATIMYSGFCCQGDGASFTANIDVPKLVAFLVDNIEGSETIGVDENGQERFKPWIVHKLGNKPECPAALWLHPYFDEMVLTVTRGPSNYVHERTCEIIGYYSAPTDTDVFDEIVDDLRTAAESLRLGLCKAIYRDLEEEYDEVTSDEHFMEDDWSLFDEDGEYVVH